MAAHVTPALAESFVTVAVKVCVPPPMSVAEVGVTETAIAGAAGAPPQPFRNPREPKTVRRNEKTERNP